MKTERTLKRVFCVTTTTISLISLVSAFFHYRGQRQSNPCVAVYSPQGKSSSADPSDALGRQAYEESIRNTCHDFGDAIPVYPQYTPAMFRELGDDKYQIVFHAEVPDAATGKRVRKNIAVALEMDPSSHKSVYKSDELEYGQLKTAQGPMITP